MEPLIVIARIYAFSLASWAVLEVVDALLHLPGRSSRDPPARSG